MVQSADVRRLNSLLEYAADLMIEVDASGLLTFANPAFLKTVGASVDEVLGRPLWDWLHPDDVPATLQAFASGMSTHEARAARFRLRAPGGIWRAVAATGVPFVDDDGLLRAVGVLRLIDDVDPLREALAQMSSVLDAVPVPVLVLDNEQHVLSLNRAARALMKPGNAGPDGPFREFAISMAGLEGAAALAEALPSMIILAIEEGQDVTRTVRYALDGVPRVIRLDVSVTIVGSAPRYVLTLTELTAEVQAVDRARQERDRAEAIIDTAPSIVMILNADGTIQEANTYLGELTGYSREEIVGADWFDTFIPEEDRERIRALFDHASNNNSTKGNVNAILTRAGERRLIQWSDRVLRDAVGGFSGLLAVGNDVTALEQAIETLRQRESLLNTVVTNAPLVIFAIDADGRFTLSEGSALALIGLQPGQVVGMSAFDLYADVPGVIESLRRALAGETVRFQSVVGTVTVEATYQPYRDRAGDVAGIIGVGFDVTDRERSMAELETLNAVLQRAERLARMGSWTIDARTWEQRWSDENYRVFGFERGGITPTTETFLTIVHPEDRDLLSQAFGEVLSTGAGSALVRVVRPDGEVRYLQSEAHAVYDEAGVPVRIEGVSQDVTDRERAMLHLQLNEERLAEAQRIAHIGSWTLDLVTNDLIWSDEIFRIFELDQEQFGASYEAFLAAIHPDDVGRVDAAYTQSLVDRQPYLITHRLLMPDGRIKWVEERAESAFAPDGTPLISRGTVQDVTEQVSLREAAERSASYLARVVASSPLPIIMIDDRGEILEANAATERAFGWTPENLLGQNVAILMADLSQDQHDMFINHYIETGEASTPEGLVVGRTRDVRARRSDGTVFPAELTVAEILLSDGGRQFIGILMDRTEWQAKEEQIIRMQKLEAVGTLVAGVSHDFNNLLTAIIGGIDMSLAHPEEPRWPALAREAADRATDLAKGLLRFSRYEEPQRTAVAPALMADAMVGMMREALDRRIWVSANVPDGLPDVLADRGQVEQVLLNLLVNARDTVIERMVQSGGDYRPSVTLSVSEQEHGGRRGVSFTVTDNGMGMRDEVRRRAFDPFYTTKPTGQGTGLGLSIVDGIIATHEGAVEIMSAVGTGTSITIWLPVPQAGQGDPLAEPDQGAGSGPEAADRQVSSRRRVLVVDDEAMIGEIAVAYLTAAGFEVVLMDNGAMAIAASVEERFDIAVVDLNMPPPDGWAVLEALLRHDPTLPVVIATGYGAEAEVLERGGAAMIHKPYGRDVLLRTVERFARTRA